ncbi:hypothetical protein GCM10009806_08980 [Microbacterium flavum]
MPGDGRQVDDVAGRFAQLVEEHFGRGDRAEEVDVDHVAVVVALRGREWAEEHDAGVVDQYVRSAEFLLHAVGGCDELLTVGDIGLDRECAGPSSAARAEIRSARRASNATRYPAEWRARAVAAPMPEEAPVMTATRGVVFSFMGWKAFRCG